MSRAFRLLGTLVIGLAVVLSGAARASAVNTGDVAVISFASDNPDALAFVVLRDIPASTVIRFTDSGWYAGGGFRAFEGGIQYTAPVELTPGTVVSRVNPFDSDGWAVNNDGLGANGFALSASGDQIITFVGDASNPLFIHAVDFDGSNYADATSSNTTALPTGLTVGTTAVDLGEADNGYYDGPTTGTPTELLAAIGDPGNWTTSNSPLTPPSWIFTVMGQGPLVQDVTLPDSTFTLGEMTTVTVTLSAAPDAGSPVTIELTSGAFSTPQQLIISNPDANGSAGVTMANEGYWTVTATATSNGVGSAESTEFTVGSPTTPPVANAGPDRSVYLSASVVIVTLAGATGDDADGLAGASYAWTPVTTNGLAGWQNRSGALNATTDPGTAQVTFDAVGTYMLTLTVTDGDGLMDSDTMTVTVSNPSADQFDPPPGYYAAATGQGSTLKAQLSQIITTGHVEQTYGDFKSSSARYDEDPQVPGNILLVYNRASVPGNWDGGVTWNREHVWPQSLQPGSVSDSSTGNLGDPHALRPSNPSINSSRNNSPYGTYADVGTYRLESPYFFPGDADKGDVARSLFYSATRYMDTLSLVNGIPTGNTMGDLVALLRWHYTDVPDFFERRRNQLIYEDQHNRSPYIDHPEFVWSVFGDGANDSTLYVSPTEPTDGASSMSINFPPIIVGGPLPAASSVTLSKAGADPTYYSVTPLGDAGSDVIGRYNAFDYGAHQRTIEVGVAALTDTPGVRSGSVVVDNMDITSEGTGQGSDDGDDVIDVSLTVYEHAEASFVANADSNALTIDFGTVPAVAGVQTAAYGIYNLASTSGFTAELNLLLITPSGDVNVLPTDATQFAYMPGGSGTTFHVELDPTAVSPGSYSATYTFEVADEYLPGWALGTPLTLTVTGTVSPALFPFDDDGDADVDALDAVGFMECVSGPDGGLLTPACANHDADFDGDVDLRDAAELQVMFTGSLD